MIKNSITFDPKNITSIPEAKANATAQNVIANCNQVSQLLIGIDDVAGRDRYDNQPGLVETTTPVDIQNSANSVTGSLLYNTASKEPVELNAHLLMPGLITGRAALTIKQVDGQKTYQWADAEVVENKNGTLTVNTLDQGV